MKRYLVKLTERNFVARYVRVNAWTPEEAKTEARNATGRWDWLKVEVSE